MPLIAVFTLHNVEELIFLERDLTRMQPLLERFGVDPGYYRKDRVVLAMVALNVLAGAALLGGSRPSRPRSIVVLTAGGLGGNALAHLARGVALRSYHGGLATSPVMLALSAAVTRQVSSVTQRQQVTRTAALGAIAAVPLTALTLRLARRVLP